jgi:hypothetical protein
MAAQATHLLFRLNGCVSGSAGVRTYKCAFGRIQRRRWYSSQKLFKVVTQVRSADTAGEIHLSARAHGGEAARRVWEDVVDVTIS